jgi:hypothetical protein
MNTSVEVFHLIVVEPLQSLLLLVVASSLASHITDVHANCTAEFKVSSVNFYVTNFKQKIIDVYPKEKSSFILSV